MKDNPTRTRKEVQTPIQIEDSTVDVLSNPGGIDFGSGLTVTDDGDGSITIDVSGGGGGGTVDTVVAGTDIAVDATDPANPIVAVSLGSDKNFVTDAEKVVIGNTSNTNTGDQTSIVGISGTTAEFNTALSDGSFATGGGTATGSNTGDQTFDDVSPMTTAGDVIYGGASGTGTRLGIGTASQVLTVNAGATAPEWADVGGGSSDSVNVETLAGNKTLTGGTDKNYQYLNPNGANRVITLDAASSVTDSVFHIYNNNVGTTTFYLSILDGAGGTEITKLYQNTDAWYIFDGTNWLPMTVTSGDVDATKKKNTAFGAEAWAEDGALAIGYDANARGLRNTAIGNGAVSLGLNATVLGFEATASSYSTALGRGSNASGVNAISIGESSVGSGANSQAIGNGSSTASGAYGTAIGYNAFASHASAQSYGYFTKSGANYAIGMGRQSATERVGEFWIGSNNGDPNDVGRGNVQFYDILAGGAGATEIFLRDEANARLTLQSSSIMTGHIDACMIDFTSGDTAAYRFEFSIQNIAGTTTLKSFVKTVLHEDDNSWDVTISADDTNDSLKITATGDGTNATEVACTVFYTEIRS